MNLYLLSQNINNGYNTYDSCVVVAKNENDARLITPSYNFSSRSWCNKVEDLLVEYIGIASKELEEGSIVISSFNAG